MAISLLAQQAGSSSDAAFKNQCRKHITLLGAYIKRYANLMLLSSESSVISIGELGLSLAEVLRYLNLYGIPGELINTAEGTVSAEKALAAFETFDELLEKSLANLSGVYVNLSERNNGLVFKITLENMLIDFPEEIIEKLNAAGVQSSFELEDNIGYFSFIISKGGDKQ